MPLSPNTTLAHYSIISKLGAGGMGEVYLAQDTRLDRKVALKILPEQFANDEDRMGRFVREAKSASALNHPNIITIYEIGESNGSHFIATEFIDGLTLNQHLRSNRQDLKSVLEIAVQVASALDEAHSAGIVHRDIKPDNVMVRANGLAKILDFGIAKLSGRGDGETGGRGEDDHTLIAASPRPPIAASTSPGMIIGTANYMSPEQAKGKQIDARTDIFSFGVVLYEMISAGLPFEGETPMEMIGAILRDEPKQLGPAVPVELRRIVSKCLRKDREERYQSIKEVCRDLNELKQDLDFQKKLQRTSVPNEPATHFFDSRTIEEAKRSSQSRPQSIVVLPFANIGSDGNDDYFSDGLTEELISDLSKIRSLKVISRNSAMKLKGTDKDLRTIVNQLDVRYVLDGSVRKAGTSLRISVQLIDGLSDANVWSEKYSGTMDDVFHMQESVSRSIVDALQLTLSTEERQQLEDRPIADPKVYDLYLRARAAFNQGDPAALDRAIALLKQGIAQIGDNELLYAALGYTHYFYFRWISKLDIDHLNSAEGYLHKTFAINPGSSHGFALQGLLSYSHGDIAEALNSLSKAVASDPANVEALLWLVVNQNYVGKCEESTQYAERLISIDPLSPLNIFISGFANIYSGEFAKSLPYVERALAIDGTSPLLLWSAIIIEAWCGRSNEVYPLVDKLAAIAPSWVYTEHALFLKHSLRGEKELALQHYTADFDKESKYDCHFALHVAHCFALLHETEKALDFLETAVRAGMVNYPFLSRLDPLLENIRHENRFQSLMREAKRSYEELNGRHDSGTHNKAETNDETKTEILKPVATADQVAKPQTNSQTINQPSKPKWWLFTLICLVVLAAGFFSYRYFSSSNRQIESIAVMPFVNQSANQDVEYLSDGMTETLISNLSQLPNLNVKPSSSVFRYKGKETSPQTIAKELNVQALLNGRVVQHGPDVSLFIELIDVSLDKVVWSETYTRKQTDLLTLQTDIARDVSVKIKSRLSGDDLAKVTKTYTNNGEAYQLYLKGNFYTSKFSKEGFTKGAEYFDEALKLDPNYALAYNGLAYNQLTAMDWFSNPKTAGPRARELVTKAAALDSSLPQTQLLLGLVAYWVDWDWPAAEKAFRRAIELNPSDPRPYSYIAWLFANTGRKAEAIELAKHGYDLDPVSPETNWALGIVLLAAGKTDEAIARFQNSIELEPTYFYSLNYLGRAYLQAGKIPQAVAAFERAHELEKENPENWANLAYAYGVSGKRGEAEKIIAHLKDLSKSNYVAPYYLGIAYAGLGDNEQTFSYIEQAYQDRSDSLILYLTADPQMQKIRTDPRYKEVLKKLNLP